MSTYGAFIVRKNQYEVSNFISKWGIKPGGTSKHLIDQYYQLYLEESSDGKVYGKSSEDLLDDIAPIVIKENPRTILDYGCGRSSLIHYFWNDGKRKLYKYDPALREYNKIFVDAVDMIICTDVLEHIQKISLGAVLKNIKRLSDKVIFTISLVPARKKLPSGENAHTTIMPREFWLELLDLYFPVVDIIHEDKNGIFLKTWK